MRPFLQLGLILAFCAGLQAQVAPSKPFVPPEEAAPKPQTPTPPVPVPGQTPVQPPTQPQVLPPSNAPRLTDNGAFLMPNASLTDLIDILAKRLKLNIIIDPNVKGSVSIFTYGEVKPVDLMPLLETVLRVNGAAIIQVGDIYRIVPMNRVSQLPMQPIINGDPKTIPDDERMVLNLIFLKYATASEMLNLVKPFLGEFATASTYDPANLLIMQDNARSMKRTMDLIGLFDSDQFASQRVRLFELSHTRPSDMQKQLNDVFKAYALSDKASAVRFIPVDSINTLIAVAPNPGVFAQVQTWIDKLDIAPKSGIGGINSYVYRLKYGRAETIAMAITALYSGNPYALMMLGAMSQMQNMAAGSGYGAGGLIGGGMNGMGMGGMGMGGMGMGGMMPGMSPYGMSPYGMPGMGYGQGMYGQNPYGAASPFQTASAAGPLNPATGAAGPADLTGQYLGAGAAGSSQRQPHVIPNPFDNTILIQATSGEYDQILDLLRQLDVAPRQVLIDAKIYEVDLTGTLSAGVSAFLDKVGVNGGSRVLSAAGTAAGLTLSTGALVLKSHELLAALSASETRSHTRIISAPSIIATDSIPATMNVGAEVPVLTSQAVTGAQQGGNSLFSNTVSNRSTGVTLSITARVNSSGIVTLLVNQNVSSPQQAASGGIQSPSFQNRSFQTQLTVQDGDTVAIGGIITESDLRGSSGVPFLNRIPGIGAAFGSKSVSKARTELIVFLTPRVIYDTNQIVEATDEIKSNLKHIQQSFKDR